MKFNVEILPIQYKLYGHRCEVDTNHSTGLDVLQLNECVDLLITIIYANEAYSDSLGTVNNGVST
jgi:hypothetical protein